ncbi:hypothetical protein [Glycomyces harbinensis]|uniref:Uncharacterized protein n=1 Tax=Glycomyces harbinensis TaxID=58114 RepID=A0A1G6RFD2_9ACTN|nr:hypothetical protein [Glycomyces harbinensis]SDD02596.1 hypothetical protein SAMN05216270_101437 [Glycomyces harbinensis]
MDEYDPFDPESNTPDFEGADLDDADAPGLDDFDDGEVPGEDDLEGFAFDGEAGLDDVDDLDGEFAEYDDTDVEDGVEAEAAGDEAPYAATYEDLLLDEADNPPSFPPELDLDVPEPVDGYPWVDLDALGQVEAEPWVNSVEASEYAIADIDDPAASALARFWQS